MFKSTYDFPNVVKFGIVNFFLEELISYGAHRQVYSHPYDDSVVIKIEHSRTHCNAQEWYFWNLVKNTKFAKWFVPCIAISDDGIVLVQKKTTEATKKQYPKKIPNFFTDTKYQNFGIYKGHLVCHDYGDLLIEKGLTKRMKNAEWWDHKV